MSKSNLTIKDALIDDQSVIKKLAANLKETDPKATVSTALSHIIKVYQNQGNNTEAQIIIEDKNKEIETLKEKIQELTEELAEENPAIAQLEYENMQLKDAIANHEKINGGLVEEIAELKAREPEKETVTVERELGKNQFILQVEDDAYNMARKCRKFLVSDGRIKGNANDPAEFFNELFDISIKYYLKNKYDNIL